MQLNIYVPKEKARVLEELEAQAKRSGRPKNEIVLAALEAYLEKPKVEWKSYPLGLGEFSRAEIYEELLDRHIPGTIS